MAAFHSAQKFHAIVTPAPPDRHKRLPILQMSGKTPSHKTNQSTEK
jgi:hypothetical protein